MTRCRVNENIALGIRRNAAHFAQIDVIGECQRIGGRIESNLRHSILGGGWEPGQQPRGNQQWQQAFHGESSPDTLIRSYRALDVFAGIGCRMSFCTRQDSISTNDDLVRVAAIHHVDDLEPAEFLAGVAEPTDDRPVQFQFVDLARDLPRPGRIAVGIGVGGEDVLVRPGR